MSDSCGPVTIAQLLKEHQVIADSLDDSVCGQNDWRFAMLGAYTEIGEAIQHLPWRPWRATDARDPSPEELERVLPELADAIGALFRCVVNLGIEPETFERACTEHIAEKWRRVISGRDR